MAYGAVRSVSLSVGEFRSALAGLGDGHWFHETLDDDYSASMGVLVDAPDIDSGDARFARDVSDRVVVATLVQNPRCYVDVEDLPGVVAGSGDPWFDYSEFFLTARLFGARLLGVWERGLMGEELAASGVGVAYLSALRDVCEKCVAGPWFVVELVDEAGGPVVGVAIEPIGSRFAGEKDVVSKMVALTHLEEPSYLTRDIGEARAVARFLVAARVGLPELIDVLTDRLAG